MELMQDPLEQFTIDTLAKIENLQLTPYSMSLQDLKRYQLGLGLYMTNLTGHLNHVQKVILQKEANQYIPPSSREMMITWCGIILLLLYALLWLIWGEVYLISLIQQIEGKVWLKWLLEAVIAGVDLFLIIAMCIKIKSQISSCRAQRLAQSQEKK